MMTYIIILLIIIFIISFGLFYRQDRKNQLHGEKLREQLTKLQLEKNQLSFEIKEQQNNLYLLKEKILNGKEQELDIQRIKDQAQRAYQIFEKSLEDQYKTKEQEFEQKTSYLEIEEKELQQKVDEIKNTFAAATAAMLQEQKVKDQQDFYRLQIPKSQIQDIEFLQEWKTKLSNPSIVSKIIWSSFVIKPASDLCNRIITSNPCRGIYKITNIKTGQVYIGQSVNIADRIKQHIKCGLGIDASATNKLYNNMQEYGVWNFTFEVLQECEKSQLNEKELFWIDIYQANKVGMNTMKGIDK